MIPITMVALLLLIPNAVMKSPIGDGVTQTMFLDDFKPRIPPKLR